jgi:hypothetical protein
VSLLYASLLLVQFPKDLEQQVCAAVHHSLLRIDELVNSISDSLKPPAAQEAEAEAEAAGSGKQADAVVQENLQDSPSPFASKENESDQRQQTAAVDATAGTLVVKPATAGLASGGSAEGLPPSVVAEAAAAPCPAPAMDGEPATAQKAEGGAAAAGDGGKSSKKPRTPRAPVSKAALRTFIIEVSGRCHSNLQLLKLLKSNLLNEIHGSIYHSSDCFT